MAYCAGVIQLGDYEVYLDDKIGQGTFGKVYMGRHIMSNEKVAVKHCEIQPGKHGLIAKIEITNAKLVSDHRNIVKFFDVQDTTNSIWMMMEFCNSGDLSKYFEEKHFLKFEEKLDLMHQSASGIAFMHGLPNPLIHRDIKPANLMLKKGKNDEVILKVTDFGLSKVLEEQRHTTMWMSTAAGTPGYMAPEFFLKEPYTSSVDVFALGLVFLAMIDYKDGCGLLPLTVEKKKMKMIMPVGMEMAQLYTMDMPMPEITEESPDDLPALKVVKELINNMVQFDKKSRIKMARVEQTLVGIEASIDSEQKKGILLYDREEENASLDYFERNGNSTAAQETPAAEIPSYQEIDRDMITFATDEKGKKVKLGDGGFAVVYLGKYKLLGNTKVAIKRIKRSEYGMKSKDMKALKREAANMFTARHPDILAIYGLVCDESVENDQLYCLVTEYMEMGSLDDVMEKVIIPWGVKVKAMCSIAKGLDYLCNLDMGGGRKLVHGDVKSKNILIDGYFKAKIGDFGLSVLQTITRTSTGVNLKGTYTHMAPEILDIPKNKDGSCDPKPTEKSDVWSFGVTMFEAAADVKGPGPDHPGYRTPFPAGMQDAQYGTLVNRQMETLFTPDQRTKIPKMCPAFYVETMERCCTVDRQQRPIFKEVLHSLTEGYDRECEKTFLGSMIELFKQVYRDVLNEEGLMQLQSNRPLVTRKVTIDDNPSVHTYPTTSDSRNNHGESVYTYPSTSDSSTNHGESVYTYPSISDSSNNHVESVHTYPSISDSSNNHVESVHTYPSISDSSTNHGGSVYTFPSTSDFSNNHVESVHTYPSISDSSNNHGGSVYTFPSTSDFSNNHVESVHTYPSISDSSNNHGGSVYTFPSTSDFSNNHVESVHTYPSISDSSNNHGGSVYTFPSTSDFSNNHGESVHTYPSPSDSSNNHGESVYTFPSTSDSSNNHVESVHTYPSTSHSSNNHGESVNPEEYTTISKNELQKLIEEVKLLREEIVKSDTLQNPEAVRNITRRTNNIRKKTKNRDDRYVKRSELDNLQQELLKIQSDTKVILEMQSKKKCTIS